MVSIRYFAVLMLLVVGVDQGFGQTRHQKTTSLKFDQFLETHCLDCHSGKDGEGGIDLDQFSTDLNSLQKTEFATRVLEQLEAELMPPRDSSELKRSERAEVIRALRSLVIKSPFGTAYRKRMQLPAFGNYIDHDLLFGGTIKQPGFTYSRIWRISPYIFESRRRAGKIKGLQNPYSFSTHPNGIRDYATVNHVDSSVIATIVMNAGNEFEYLVEQAKKEQKNSSPKKRRRKNPFAPFVNNSGAITDADMVSVVQSTLNRILARAPKAAERDRYVALLKQNIETTKQPLQSLRSVFISMYVSSESIYRFELGSGQTDQWGRQRLEGRELAEALSYALFDNSPFQGGRTNASMIAKALDEGKLETREQIRQLLTRILEQEKFPPGRGESTPRLMRFFREFFGYHRAADVFKDNQRVNEHGIYHDPRQLIKDADNLIKSILREDKNVFQRLLITNEAYVFHDGDNTAADRRHAANIKALSELNDEWARKTTEKRINGIRKKPKYKANPKLMERTIARIKAEENTLVEKERKRLEKLIKAGPAMKPVRSRNRRYASAYNINMRTWKWPKVQPFELPREQRAGILTHPAWLAAYSTNDDNDPVHRGIWVYEKLLAGVVANVPPDVDARIPEDAKKTLHERLQVVQQQSCWKCHYKINPLGESFEMFDDFGRFRTHYYFDESANLLTQTHRAVTDEDGKIGFRSLARDQKVTEGVYSKRPIKVQSDFDALGIPGLTGKFDNAVDMIHKIAKTDRARQSIIRHLFRYLLGRNEMLSDSQSLIAADRAYVDSGGSFKAVVISILTSDSFLYRRPKPGTNKK